METITKEKKNTYTQKKFTYDEALKSAIAYFDGDELAAGVWLSKYALKDNNGEYLECTPDATHKRMAKEFSRIENLFTEKNKKKLNRKNLSLYGQTRNDLTESAIFELFEKFKYVVPQGSIMSSLGNPFSIASLSNCIVLPEIYDSYGGIFYTDQQMAQLFKRRCGVGIDISSLRPEGANVTNAAGTTSGPVSFMERYSNTTREVAQNGRRGALMITMDIKHPDIEKFITIKQDLSKITGANISVRISDEFMKAVEANEDFALQWPIDSANPKVIKVVKAQHLWNQIILCAHKSAEPGIIFWDRQHEYSTSSLYPGFKNTSTNPCSEIAMQGGDSCRLMAINLFSFVENPFTEKATFNYQKFFEITYESQRLMDDLVELELEAVKKIMDKINNDPEPDTIKSVELETWKLLYENGKKGRRTGLGFTGLADALAAMGLKYDSEASLEEVHRIMKLKCEAEFDSSIDMAIERGKFSGYNNIIENRSDFIKMMKEEMPHVYSRMQKYGRRNISISTVAPTGTISMLTQTSSGIEPVFMTSYKRRKKISLSATNDKADFIDDLGDRWKEYTVYHHKVKEWMDINPGKDVNKSPYQGATANDIDWKNRIRLQAVVQKFTTHSISSTINLKSETSVDTVKQIYLKAWKEGLKGITVYRDGSRAGVLVSNSTTEKEKNNDLIDTIAPVRPQTLQADIVRFNNDNEKWIAFVGILNNRPYEIFTGKANDSFLIPEYIAKGWIIKEKSDKNKSRYDFQYIDQDGYKVTIEGLSRSFNKEYWNYAKLISGVLRHGMPIIQAVNLIENLHLDNDYINSWKNGVVRTLKKYVANGTKLKDKTCESCGDTQGLIFEEGCIKCKSCGNTKCG